MLKQHKNGCPSDWIVKWAPLIIEKGKVLDIACGSGRHSVFLANAGHFVTALDKDVSRLPHDPQIKAIKSNLEDLSAWPLVGKKFNGIIVTNFLYRPLFPVISRSLLPGGVLIYETFGIGNESYGRPRSKRFLLQPGELLEAFSREFVIIAYENGIRSVPSPAVIQRIIAIRKSKNYKLIRLPN
tara:strand:- start:244 stop:795 length:552 start_codon:yes stop_codon:yes gene_type:complete